MSSPLICQNCDRRTRCADIGGDFMVLQYVAGVEYCRVFRLRHEGRIERVGRAFEDLVFLVRLAWRNRNKKPSSL